jgi:hypothetical protein
MSLTGGHLDALVAAGATVEQIVALVKADMAEREAALEAKRAKDAERQRRHRESRDVTVTNADSRDTPSPFAPPKKDPKPQKITPPISPIPEDLSVGTDPPLTKKEILEAWDQRMVPLGFPAVRKMTAQRERQLKARLKDSTIEDWQRAMDALERSPFLRGDNDRGWRADFDFLLQPKSFTKLIEGAYDH